MKHLPKKWIAVLMALWLPLFAGNALAISCGDCDESLWASSDVHQAHAAGPISHLAQTGYMSQCDHQHDQFNHKGCGFCTFSCSGHMTAIDSMEIAAVVFGPSSFAPGTVQFQSTTFAPLLPPPLARV